MKLANTLLVIPLIGLFVVWFVSFRRWRAGTLGGRKLRRLMRWCSLATILLILAEIMTFPGVPKH